MDPDIQPVDTTLPLDVSPISIPDHDVAPSIQDRVNFIEEILHI